MQISSDRIGLGWMGILALLAGCGDLNQPPELTLTAVPAVAKTDEQVTITWEATDDGTGLRVAVDTDGDGTLEPVSPTGSVQVSFPEPGTIILRGEVEDFDGVITQAQVQIEIQPRQGNLDILVE